MNWYIVCFVLSVALSSSTAARIPSYIHICKRNDPRASRCIKESVEYLRPKLKSGIPEIGVPALDPLLIKEIVIFRGGPNSNLGASLLNIEARGAGDFEITKLKLDIDKLTFKVGIKIPLLRLNGDYDIDARILVAPIKGNGKFQANVRDIEGQGILQAELIEKEGHRYLTFTNFDFSIIIGDYHLHLDNLFNGDKTLSDAANELLNDNKPEFISAATPFIERTVSDILLESANKITRNLDWDEVFPEK